MQNITLSNQIVKIQTNKNLIATFDKLQYAGLPHYAQIHAKKEKDPEKNGQKQGGASLIGVILQDYSNGTGANNIITQFNLAPEQIQFLLTRVSCGFQEYDWSQSKIFGEPNQNGLSIVQTIQVSRHMNRKDGSIANNPWFIAISNGFGVRVKNSLGGYYMQRGSFRQDKYAAMNLSDMDMYTLLKRTDSYIRNWEMAVSMQQLLNGKENYLKYAASRKQDTGAYAPQERQHGAYQYQQPQSPQNNPYAQAAAAPANASLDGWASGAYGPVPVDTRLQYQNQGQYQYQNMPQGQAQGQYQEQTLYAGTRDV